jgi:hypothetical protein
MKISHDLCALPRWATHPTYSIRTYLAAVGNPSPGAAHINVSDVCWIRSSTDKVVINSGKLVWRTEMKYYRLHDCVSIRTSNKY